MDGALRRRRRTGLPPLGGGAQLGIEERSPQLDGGEDAEVAFAHRDEGG